MTMSALRGLAAASALCLLPAAQAATMDLTVEGSIPSSSVNAYYAYAGSQIGFQWVAEAQNFVSALQGSTFGLQLAYDSAAVASGSPPVFTDGVSIVGGSLAGVTDFSDWAPSVRITQSGGVYGFSIEGRKMVFDFPDPLRPGRDQYIYFAITGKFSAPAPVAGITELPQSAFSLADLTEVYGEFGYRGGDSGGLEYAFWRTGNFSGLAVAPAVPEPGSWAMMLAGLAGVAALARRRRG